MRKFIVALVCLGIIVSWQIVQLDTANASGKNHNGRCSFAGTWITESEDGGKTITTVIPLDPAGRKFSLTSESLVPDDPTFFGFYPEATNVTKIIGVAVKTSNNTYDFSQYQFASKVEGEQIEQQYDLVFSGTTKLIDCDRRVNTFSIELTDYVYGIGTICLEDSPFTSESERIKVVPPCSPDSEE
jgi:hypothetical protein